MNDAIELMVAERVLHDGDDLETQQALADDYAQRYGWDYFPRKALAVRLEKLRRRGGLEFSVEGAGRLCSDLLAAMLEPGAEDAPLPAQSDCEELRWLVAEHVLERVWNRLDDDDDPGIEHRSNPERTNPYWFSTLEVIEAEAQRIGMVCGLRGFGKWLSDAVQTPCASYDHNSARLLPGARGALQVFLEGVIDVAREHSRP